MAAAQAEREMALRQSEEAQRKRATMARIRNTALVAVSIFAVLAGLLALYSVQQRKVAEEQRAVAEQQRATAQEQRGQLDDMLAGATDVIATVFLQLDDDTMKKVFEVF